MCFLDASMSFDRVKHTVLFNKLTRRGVPGYIVKLLSYWYAKQTMRVRWGDCISSPFQGWVQLHKITSITITITLKYQLQLQLHHHDVILNYNYNYTMFISITIIITAQFLHKLHFYLWNCGLIGFGCFPCLNCLLFSPPLSLAMLFGSIILQHLIAYHVWDFYLTRSYQVKRQQLCILNFFSFFV